MKQVTLKGKDVKELLDNTTPDMMEVEQDVDGLMLTGAMLKDLLEFVNPDGLDSDDTEDQLDTEVTVMYLNADLAPWYEGVQSPAGFYAYITDYPDEGTYGPLGVDLTSIGEAQ